MFRHDGDTDWWWNGGEGDRSMYMWPQRNPVYYPPTNFDGRHERSVDRDDASPGTRGIGTDAVPEENYSYRVKIINPHKRSDFQIREIHNFKKRLESITELRVKLIEEFGELVPANTDFQVGYFLGKQAAKHWLANKDDLTLMYTSLGTKCELLLWCEARSEKAKDVTKSVKKRMSVDASDSRPPSKRQLIEEDVSETVAELKFKIYNATIATLGKDGCVWKSR